METKCSSLVDICAARGATAAIFITQQGWAGRDHI